MRILYITPQLPYPPISGGRIKTNSSIKALIELGVDVILISFLESLSEKKYISHLKQMGINKVITVYNREIGERSRKKQLLRIVKSIFGEKPYGILRYYDKTMEYEICHILSKHKVDVVWVNLASMIQYLPKKFQGLKIYEGHDIDSQLYKEAFLKGVFWHLKLLHFLEWIKYFFYEKKYLKNFDRVFCISDTDKKILATIIPDNKLTVLSPAIELKHRSISTPKEPNTLLFVGTLFWYPNKDGITWFLREVFPLIKAKIPSIKLWIIGKYSPNFKPVQMEGVKFLGFVDNIESYMNRAQVFIVPIRYGTGVRIKILEAMSWGIPVVTTSEGAIGLEVKDGRELLIAKNEKEFAEKISILTKDKQLKEKLLENSTKFLIKNYSKEKLLEVINRILSN